MNLQLNLLKWYKIVHESYADVSFLNRIVSHFDGSKIKFIL